MSDRESIFFQRKFKLFFFSASNRYVTPWFIIWPEGLSYAAWECLLKRHLSFIGSAPYVRPKKLKKRKKFSRRYRKFLLAQTRIKNGLVAQQTSSIINELEAPLSTDVGNCKIREIHVLALIGMDLPCSPLEFSNYFVFPKLLNKEVKFLRAALQINF